MTRIFYDAINPNNLPVGGDGYLGYDDGNWPDASDIQAKFPDKLVGLITVNPKDNKGSIGDGPPDNGKWSDWVNWVVMRRAAGEDPTINTNTSNWTAGQAAFNAAGVKQPHWWLAHYSNTPPDLKNLPAIPAGAIALQCYDYGGYDISVVADYWPGVDRAPATTQTSVASTDEEESMQAQDGYVTFSWSQGDKHIVQVAFDTVGGNQPDLRVVLLLDTGPLVLSNSWKPDHTDAGKTVRFPTEHLAAAYGLELQPVGSPARYAASVS